MEGKSFQHLNPVWREKANFIIGASVPPLEEKSKEEMWEQLWARRIDDKHYEICCIPMFAYGLALGDVVETDRRYMIVNVARKSGRVAIRVWFHEKTPLEKRDEIVNEILDVECLLEWYSQHLLGIDSDSLLKTQSLDKILRAFQAEGIIEFEYGNPQSSPKAEI